MVPLAPCPMVVHPELPLATVARPPALELGTGVNWYVPGAVPKKEIETAVPAPSAPDIVTPVAVTVHNATGVAPHAAPPTEADIDARPPPEFVPVESDEPPHAASKTPRAANTIEARRMR